MDFVNAFRDMFSTFSEGGGIEVKIFSGLILLIVAATPLVAVYFLGKSTHRVADGTMTSLQNVTANISEGVKAVFDGVGNLLSVPHSYIGVLQTYADNAAEKSSIKLIDELGREISGEFEGNGANHAVSQLMDSMKSGGAPHALFTSANKRDPQEITVVPTGKKAITGPMGGGRRLLGGGKNG